MDAAGRCAILSVRPHLAAAIVRGAKRVEVRRRPPGLRPGDTVLVYATSPEMAVLGTVIVEGTIEDSPERLWRRAGSKMGIDHATFRAYVNGSPRAFGILVTCADRFESVVPLAEVRRLLGGFHPPRTYSYLRKDAAETIVRAGSRLQA